MFEEETNTSHAVHFDFRYNVLLVYIKALGATVEDVLNERIMDLKKSENYGFLQST